MGSPFLKTSDVQVFDHPYLIVNFYAFVTLFCVAFRLCPLEIRTGTRKMASNKKAGVFFDIIL